MNVFQAPTLPDISDDKEEWPSLGQNAFEAQFQSNNKLFNSYYMNNIAGGCPRKKQGLCKK